jgi:hypothetical protein
MTDRRRPRVQPEADTLPILSDDEIEVMLWNDPGMSDDEITKCMSPAQRRAFSQSLDRMIDAGRVTAVRFTCNAPFLQTRFRYFATAKGRIEVVGQDGISYAYVHDPLGTWDEAMRKAQED